MFAGDNFKPAANASYRKFDAGPSFHIGSNVRRNNEIGTIDSWGPLFRISLDLIIHSYDQIDRRDNDTLLWSNVLTFKGNGGTSDYAKFGDRIPGIFINNEREEIWFNIYGFSIRFPINLNTWANILIEQNIVKRNKVRGQQLNQDY